MQKITLKLGECKSLYIPNLGMSGETIKTGCDGKIMVNANVENLSLEGEPLSIGDNGRCHISITGEDFGNSYIYAQSIFNKDKTRKLFFVSVEQ